MGNRLIVWYDGNDRVLGAFNSVIDASSKTGVPSLIINKSLRGTYSRTKEGWRFAYEIKASDLHKIDKEERKRKQEKINKLWKD